MKNVLPVIFFLLIARTLAAQYDAARYPVIPRPQQLLPFSGEFQLTSQTVILTDNKFYHKEIELFRREVKQQFGVELKYASKAGKGNAIYISEDSSDIPHEGYFLFVNRNEINLYGGHAGIFYGLQTLLQLVHYRLDSTVLDPKYVDDAGTWYSRHCTIPSCSIVDAPRFPWRGMHLDVSRHFFPKDSVKEYLRWMAMYKLNTFHWHLTDDQGWRIEIKKYPKLTQTGAWRNGTLIGHYGERVPRYDTIRYGGFYTQDDIREIVKYADSLHITIVPEIEMPGHASAMLAAYPELGCTNGPFFVQKTWGVFDDVLCPREETFAFLDDVLKEVCALFPGKYIHIGGDECPKAEWKTSPFCQDLMQKNNLKTEEELQSWFTRRIVDMLKKKGKEAIGWDEILEGGLAEGAAVMSWRGEDGGIAAAKAKHNVVMSPGGFCYFDHYQSQSMDEPLAIGGFLPIEKVYSYDPVPASLSADEKKFIMGVQANLWTEYIGDWQKVQYMIFPRICALAEVAWTTIGNKDYSFFVNRLVPHFQLLNRKKISYASRVFEPHATITPDPDGNGIWLAFDCAVKDAVIKTTGLSSKANVGVFEGSYTRPIHITRDTTIEAISMVVIGPDMIQTSGPVFEQFYVSLATGKKITLRKAPSPSYNTGGAFALVDGVSGQGTQSVRSGWLGFWGDTLDATIDLGKDTIINTVTLRPLDDKASWIHLPSDIKIFVSEDGKTFSEAEKSRSWGQSEFPLIYFLKKSHARYVRVVLYPLTEIPEGEPGAGNPAWIFLDEIIIH